jgi:hypothetical protein
MAEQGCAGDTLQRPLRSRFRVRLASRSSTIGLIREPARDSTESAQQLPFGFISNQTGALLTKLLISLHGMGHQVLQRVRQTRH